VRIVFAGTPEVAVPSLETLHASRHEVVAVVTRPDAAIGRGRTMRPSPVAETATSLGLEVLKPAKVRDEAFLARLRELGPDCCPVVAYGALLPQVALDIPPRGWVNLHFSVLPRWRGAAPVQHAVLAGDTETGATTFRIVPALDAGPVYRTLIEPIGPADTSGDLLTRLAVSGAGLLVDTLDGIEAGTLEAVPQLEDGVTVAPKITVEDGEIDWRRPTAELDRQIRGFAPAPGAWTTFRGDRFKINSAQPDNSRDLGPGVVEVTKRALRVGTGDGSMLLGEVKAQGRKPMPAPDWARGITWNADDHFGD
jgi:methionyl-tRNA formyltransferase